MPVAINGVDKQGVDINGVQAKQALSDANSTVNKGVYNATLLETVDADLAVGNILTGKTIFGKAGTVTPMDVSDADAAVADVKDPKTFYSVAAPRKTGTMPTVAIVAANDNYPAGYHAGDAGGLDAIDLDLASANIKSGVTIFGFLGTYLSTLSQDLVASDSLALTTDTNAGWYKFFTVVAGADYDLATTTNIFSANSMAVAVGYFHGDSSGADYHKLRLYMNGVQVAESDLLTTTARNKIVVGTRALSGSKICKISMHNYNASNRSCYGYGHYSGDLIANGIGVGSIKAT